jgi:hypothetical protein
MLTVTQSIEQKALMEVVQKMMKEGGNEADLAKLMESMGGAMPGGGAGEPNVSACACCLKSLAASCRALRDSWYCMDIM